MRGQVGLHPAQERCPRPPWRAGRGPGEQLVDSLASPPPSGGQQLAEPVISSARSEAIRPRRAGRSPTVASARLMGRPRAASNSGRAAAMRASYSGRAAARRRRASICPAALASSPPSTSPRRAGPPGQGGRHRDPGGCLDQRGEDLHDLLRIVACPGHRCLGDASGDDPPPSCPSLPPRRLPPPGARRLAATRPATEQRASVAWTCASIQGPPFGRHQRQGRPGVHQRFRPTPPRSTATAQAARAPG